MLVPDLGGRGTAPVWLEPIIHHVLLKAYPRQIPNVHDWEDGVRPGLVACGIVGYAGRDNGHSWSTPKPLHEGGKARYSDLAMTQDGTVLCLYTNGNIRDSEKISVSRFDLDWVKK